VIFYLTGRANTFLVGVFVYFALIGVYITLSPSPYPGSYALPPKYMAHQVGRGGCMELLFFLREMVEPFFLVLFTWKSYMPLAVQQRHLM
jgi:hypothetical protein